MVTSNNLCQNSHNLHAARIEKLSSGKKKGGEQENNKWDGFVHWMCLYLLYLPCVRRTKENSLLQLPLVRSHRAASSYFSTGLTKESSQEQKGEYKGSACAQPLFSCGCKVVSRESSKDHHDPPAGSGGLRAPLRTVSSVWGCFFLPSALSALEGSDFFPNEFYY